MVEEEEEEPRRETIPTLRWESGTTLPPSTAWMMGCMRPWGSGKARRRPRYPLPRRPHPPTLRLRSELPIAPKLTPTELAAGTDMEMYDTKAMLVREKAVPIVFVFRFVLSHSRI